jgi:hypothetical protein
LGLDINKAASQLEQIASLLGEAKDDQSRNLALCIEHFNAGYEKQISEKLKVSKGQYSFNTCSIETKFLGRYSAKELPANFTVLSVDGSHIDVDRHISIPMALMNIGGSILKYGANPNASLFSRPTLLSGPDLLLRDSDTGSVEPIEGNLLEIYRSVEEVTALADEMLSIESSEPILAIIDGSLTLWGIDKSTYPQFVKNLLFDEKYIRALRRIQEASNAKHMSIMAYISFPRNKDVINALRLSFCPFDIANCQQHCSKLSPGERQCDSVHNLFDRDIFIATLKPKERSELFRSESSLMGNYGDNRVYFYYLHTGEEIARIEVPEWVAKNSELLEISHSIILDQCNKGLGYPVSIAEAHEQAVLKTSDRQYFEKLIQETISAHAMEFNTSEKSRSKRIRPL